MEEFDVVVIGSGHAGCEAALALSRLNNKTMLATLNLDSIAFLACNPSIGGTAKGQLASEVDALGGEMGVNADKNIFFQYSKFVLLKLINFDNFFFLIYFSI